MNILALDLGTKMGWASSTDGVTTSGTENFNPGRFEGGGMRYLRFRNRIQEMIALIQPEAVYFEEVRTQVSADAAHAYGGFMAHLVAVCEELKVPYKGIPVGTIKKHATGKGNANKEAMMSAAAAKWPDQGIKDDNQADALWILSCGMEMNKEPF